MPSATFEYIATKRRIFGTVRRPLVDIEAKTASGDWLELKEVLADTGADISVLPRHLAALIVADAASGKRQEIKGIVPVTHLTVFLHQLTFRIQENEFTLPVAIADSDDVPPILGRAGGLDLFAAVFDGKRLRLEWEP